MDICITYTTDLVGVLLFQLLREQIARHRVGTTDEGMDTRHFPAHEREDLVHKLETSRDQVSEVTSKLNTNSLEHAVCPTCGPLPDFK